MYVYMHKCAYNECVFIFPYLTGVSFNCISCYLQVNPKAAESLADPEEYPNLFEDWQVALSVESRSTEAR